MASDVQKEYRKEAEAKLAEAEALVEKAAEYLRAAGLEARALDAKEALEYIHGALGG